MEKEKVEKESIEEKVEKVVLPSTESHIVKGSDVYDVLVFPMSNLLGFRTDSFEIDVNNYPENLKIRPQRKIRIDYEGKIVSDRIHSGIDNQWIEKIESETGYSEDISDDNFQYEDNITKKEDKNLIPYYRAFDSELLKSLEAFEYQVEKSFLLKEAGIAMLTYSNLDLFPEIQDVKVRDFRQVRNHYFTLTQISGVLYILSENTLDDADPIIKFLYCPEYDMQDGDSHTYFYLLNEQHFVVYNDGDVYSVLLFVADNEL